MTHITTAGEFGAALRTRRRELGLTQEDLAIEAGVGRRFVIDLERGKHGASLETALRCARLVGLDIAMEAREHDARP